MSKSENIPFNIGDVVQIIQAGNGAMGCNGKYCIVVDESHKHGILSEADGFNISISDWGIWRVNPPGKHNAMYTLLNDPDRVSPDE